MTGSEARAVGAVSQHAVDRWSAGRDRYLDNLKVVLIAAIIAMHGILGYAGTSDAWTYTWLREVTLSPVVEAVLLVLAMPFGLILMALLFLVAGLLSVPSMQRKGPGQFARDRLVRLGIPFVVYVLLIQPVTVYSLEHPLGAAPGSYWHEFLGDEGILDTGPLWFVGVLLIFSLVYAGWVWLRGQPGTSPSRPVSARRLALAAAVVAPASFVIRLAWPYGSDAGPTDLNYWQWPACIAVFAIGLTASRRGWQQAVPDQLRRTCRAVTALAVVAMAALLLVSGLTDRVDDLFGGWNAFAVTFAAVDAVLCLFGSIWMLTAAQRHLTRPLPAGRELARSAYGAFILQTPVLIGLALALRPVEVPAEVKAFVVAGGGIAVSFGLAWLLVSRVPGVSRVL